ncbi:MAG TPA: sugar ABC transporter substrate-binding protein [Kaistia sp.]|nr:sugar ABC transporter substrate-binding protein [Kaistia sp.]
MDILKNAARLAAAAGCALVLSTAARAEPVTLTWFMWSGSDAEVAAWKHVAGLVTEKYPDIKIEFQTASWPDYWTKLPALAASGQLPDIISLQSMRTPGFANLFEPLDAYAKKDSFDLAAFDTSIIQGLTDDGGLRALPYDFGPMVMFYNQDMFQKYKVEEPKVGWTNDDFLKAAKALTVDGNYGTAQSVPDVFFAYARSAGANYLKDGALDLTNEPLKAAFQSYVDVVAKDKVAPLFPASGTPSGAQANGRFVAGSVGMYVDGPWSLINVKDSVKFKVGIAPLPAGAAGSISLSAGSGFGISSSGKHKDEAWKAIQVLTGPEAEEYLASNGRAFAARNAQQKFWYESAAKGVANAQPTIEAALKTAEPYKTTAEWNTVSQLFEQYAPLAFAGSQSAGTTLDQIQQLSTQ